MLPLSKPLRGQDDSLLNEIFVPRGTLIYSGNQLSNTNKELWGEDAEEWKPERWLSSLPEALKEAKIPGVYSHLWVLCAVLLQVLRAADVIWAT